MPTSQLMNSEHYLQERTRKKKEPVQEMHSNASTLRGPLGGYIRYNTKAVAQGFCSYQSRHQKQKRQYL